MYARIYNRTYAECVAKAQDGRWTFLERNSCHQCAAASAVFPLPLLITVTLDNRGLTRRKDGALNRQNYTENMDFRVYVITRAYMENETCVWNRDERERIVNGALLKWKSQNELDDVTLRLANYE